ncbi:MAG TPA: hypothetical protein DCS93_00525 [Microscillaceae bacterium]|nr:hypothetical protein [Microscillaceae bacterium]
MWSKLNKTLSKFIKNSDDNDQEDNDDVPEQAPTELIEITIQELEEAIVKTQSSLEQTSDNQQNIKAQLLGYQRNAADLYRQAMEASKKGQDIQAQELVRKKNLAEKQAAQYQVLYTNVSGTVHQFESQIEKMRLKIQELRSKEVILKAKLENAKTQKELGTYLTELNQSADLEAFEDELNEIELEAKLVNDLQSLDEEEFDQMETQAGMASLQDDIAAEERRLQEERDTQRFKKINQIFDRNTSHEKQLSKTRQKNYQAKKQKLMEALMQQNVTPESSDKKSDQFQTFFENTHVENTPAPTQETSKSQQILDDFAQQTTPKSSADTPKDSENKSGDKQTLFDDFFGDKDATQSDKPSSKDASSQEESDQTPKSANQKKIDDFFND